MNTRIVPAGLLLAGCLVPAMAASAGGLLDWQSGSLTFLAGDGYRVQPASQATVTLEYANGWRYGDTFLFIDATRFDGGRDPSSGRSVLYGEFAPRLSLGKISGRDMEIGVITDVLLATGVEFGEGPVETLLLGPGFDLQVPGFDYLQLNVYRRDARGDRDGDGMWQITPAWAVTVPVGRSDLLIDGYVDWVTGSDGRVGSHLHFNPQIKYDLGKRAGWGDKTVYVGVEYDFWKNKFGIDDDGAGRGIPGGTDQSTASLLLKVHLP